MGHFDVCNTVSYTAFLAHFIKLPYMFVMWPSYKNDENQWYSRCSMWNMSYLFIIIKIAIAKWESQLRRFQAKTGWSRNKNFRIFKMGRSRVSTLRFDLFHQKGSRSGFPGPDKNPPSVQTSKLVGKIWCKILSNGPGNHGIGHKIHQHIRKEHGGRAALTYRSSKVEGLHTHQCRTCKIWFTGPVRPDRHQCNEYRKFYEKYILKNDEGLGSMDQDQLTDRYSLYAILPSEGTVVSDGSMNSWWRWRQWRRGRRCQYEDS